MRQRLQAYNTLLVRSFIDVPSLEEPVIQAGEGRPIGYWLDHHGSS